MVHEPSTNSDAECGELMDGRGCLKMDGTMVEERRCFCNMAPLSLYLYIYMLVTFEENQEDHVARCKGSVWFSVVLVYLVG